MLAMKKMLMSSEFALPSGQKLKMLAMLEFSKTKMLNLDKAVRVLGVIKKSSSI